MYKQSLSFLKIGQNIEIVEVPITKDSSFEADLWSIFVEQAEVLRAIGSFQ